MTILKVPPSTNFEDKPPLRVEEGKKNPIETDPLPLDQHSGSGASAQGRCLQSSEQEKGAGDTGQDRQDTGPLPVPPPHPPRHFQRSQPLNTKIHDTSRHITLYLTHSQRTMMGSQCPGTGTPNLPLRGAHSTFARVQRSQTARVPSLPGRPPSHPHRSNVPGHSLSSQFSANISPSVGGGSQTRGFVKT